MHDDHSILRDLGFWVAVVIGCSAILAGGGAGVGVIDLVLTFRFFHLGLRGSSGPLLPIVEPETAPARPNRSPLPGRCRGSFGGPTCRAVFFLRLCWLVRLGTAPARQRFTFSPKSSPSLPGRFWRPTYSPPYCIPMVGPEVGYGYGPTGASKKMRAALGRTIPEAAGVVCNSRAPAGRECVR